MEAGRLGRSIQHLIEVVTPLGDRGVGFRSLTEGFDTTTPGGKLLFHVLGALAHFERDLIREHTEYDQSEGTEPHGENKQILPSSP